MRDDLGARPAELQLVVAGYGIGFSVFLITGGRLPHQRVHLPLDGGAAPD
jgi:hypothetical protein